MSRWRALDRINRLDFHRDTRPVEAVTLSEAKGLAPREAVRRLTGARCFAALSMTDATFAIS